MVQLLVETLRYKPEGCKFDALEFLIDLSLLAAVWLWSQQSLLTEISMRGVSLGVNVASAQG